MSILHGIVQPIIYTASIFLIYLDVYIQSFTKNTKNDRVPGFVIAPHFLLVDQQYELCAKPVHSGAFQQYVTKSIGIY